MSEARRRSRRCRALPLSLVQRVRRTGRAPISGMAIIREHLAGKGLGLFNDLQTEHSIVGNNVGIVADARVRKRGPAAAGMGRRICWKAVRAISPSASPSPDARLGCDTHGDDLPCVTARRLANQWRENLEYRHSHRFPTTWSWHARAGKAGDAETASPRSWCPPTPTGFKVEEMLWTFNMPTDHGRVSLTDVYRVGDDAIFGEEGTGLAGGPALLQREPHSPGGIEPGRRAVLHRRVGRLREGAQALRQAPGQSTRRSSSRWSSCRPNARCCAR